MANKSEQSPVASLVLAAVIAIGAAVGIATLSSKSKEEKVGSAPVVRWAATAPGRVEPKLGELRLAATSPGRIIEVAARLNDRIVAGDMLVRVEDEDARAKVAAAEAETAVRKRERDAEAAVGKPATDRRLAEDSVALAERALALARQEFDRVHRLWRAGAAAEEAMKAERSNVAASIDKLEQERSNLRKALAAPSLPLPTRLEAALTTARADLSTAETAFERTRLRAPADGTVLQVLARVGEVAGLTTELPLVVVGDISSVRVRAEVEERDLAKVQVGQAVIVRTDAFPGRDFTGRVATLAQMLTGAKIAQRGPRRPTDVDTLEVLIDIDAAGLMPGMRVDVFFKNEQAPAPAAQKPTAAVTPAAGSSTTAPAAPAPAASAPSTTAPAATPAAEATPAAATAVTSPQPATTPAAATPAPPATKQ